MAAIQEVLGSYYYTGSSVQVLHQGDSWILVVNDWYAKQFTRHTYESYQEALILYNFVDTKFRQEYEDYIAEARARLPQNHIDWIVDNCNGE